MGIPVAPNTTCDVYLNNGAPPSAPDTAGVPCYLELAYEQGTTDRVGTGVVYTHVMLVDCTVDVRDRYTGLGAVSGSVVDSVYVPDKDGQQYKVRFVGRVGRGTQQDHLRIYLDRAVLSVFPAAESA